MQKKQKKNIKVGDNGAHTREPLVCVKQWNPITKPSYGNSHDQHSLRGRVGAM